MYRAQTNRSVGRLFGKASLLPITLLLAMTQNAMAQIGPASGDRGLALAPDSPFQDPDLIYLEADEVINNENAGLLIAIGEVEGRYEDRTLRAERVEYDINTGSVIAKGNVVLIDANGDVQYADNIQLDDRLDAGIGVNYTARLASGATTAARAVARDENGEFELYTVTYTACDICEESEKKAKTPTWRIKARRVRQDSDSRSVRYRDAVVEFFGIPVFYTPYLAHPDPTLDRASGLLFPRLGHSSSVGAFYRQPYYWAVDPYTEVTAIPHIYSGKNPLLELEARRKFFSGDIVFDGSFTYETLFDNDGVELDNPALFTDPTQAEKGDELSSHFFLDGYFKPSEALSYGYTVMLQTDDNYRERYRLNNSFTSRGPLQNFVRLNTNQAFVAAQGEQYRILAVAGGYQSLETTLFRDEATGLINVARDNNDQFPIIAPKISAEGYFDDPLFDGRIKAHGDFVSVTREATGDYMRGSAGLEYSKSMILSPGIEVRPFAWGRYDSYALESNDEDIDFSRFIGQAGIDARYPFIRKGSAVDLIIEPRAQIVESFGDAKLENFTDSTGRSLFESGASPDLDRVLLFEANKADGVDFFENGTRADLGVTLRALWGEGASGSEVSVFGGRSFVRNPETPFDVGSGLSSTSPEFVGEIGLQLGRRIDARALARYNEDTQRISRIDSLFTVDLDYISATGRYYRVDEQQTTNAVVDAVNQELSASLNTQSVKGWSLGYSFLRDLDDDVTRSQRFSINYRDECTMLELYYDIRDANNNIIINDAQFGFRLTLTTLGGAGTF